MYRRVLVSGGLLLLLGFMACSNTDRSGSVLTPVPHGSTGDVVVTPLLRCPVHSSLVKVTLPDTESGLVADFATEDPLVVPWLREAVLSMVPIQAGALGTLGQRITDGSTDRGGGDRATGHGVLPLDQMPPTRIWAEKTDTGVCIQFAPKDPAELDRLRVDARTIFKSLIEGACFE